MDHLHGWGMVDWTSQLLKFLWLCTENILSVVFGQHTLLQKYEISSDVCSQHGKGFENHPIVSITVFNPQRNRYTRRQLIIERLVLMNILLLMNV